MGDDGLWLEYVAGEGYVVHTEESVLEAMLVALLESGIALPLPETAANTADLTQRVAALRRIAHRLTGTDA